TLGAYLFALGVLLFIVNVFRSRRHGRPAGDNPWDAGTLEWSVPSPPPPYNFATIPIVASRHPLWEDRLPNEGTGKSVLRSGPVLDNGRETFGTSPLDGEPAVVMEMPDDSPWPFLLALSLTVTAFALLIPSNALAVAAIVGAVVSVIGWFSTTSNAMVGERVKTRFGALPVNGIGTRSVGWWGMVWVIATEASFFAYLLFSYFYLASTSSNPWPTGGNPDLRLAIVNTAILLASSAVLEWGRRSGEKGNWSQLRLAIGLTALMGVIFLILQGFEYHRKLTTITPSTDAYGSLFYTITGFHGAHVFVGVLMLLTILFRGSRAAARGEGGGWIAVSNVTMYWHFVDAVWIAVFTSLYISPYLG
ncbi:MAG: cytochrome c oxidase subunit 3, partial [Gemmatimonadaceae bacterium]